MPLGCDPSWKHAVCFNLTMWVTSYFLREMVIYYLWLKAFLQPFLSLKVLFSAKHEINCSKIFKACDGMKLICIFFTKTPLLFVKSMIVQGCASTKGCYVWISALRTDKDEILSRNFCRNRFLSFSPYMHQISSCMQNLSLPCLILWIFLCILGNLDFE